MKAIRWVLIVILAGCIAVLLLTAEFLERAGDAPHYQPELPSGGWDRAGQYIGLLLGSLVLAWITVTTVSVVAAELRSLRSPRAVPMDCESGR